MRRILAIAMVLSLACATGLPLWASACASMKTTPMCHRMAVQHHCEMEQQDDSADQKSLPVINSESGYCPMHCCTQYTASTSIVVVSISSPILLPVTTDRIYSHSPIFVTNGFSSHTDRGPPLA